ncbi:MAG: OmpA family protein [Elusimicrobiota bacterium]|jgi:outer membrane protein OmpA-like peptidoglycan-associated protein|nr:OmpA family protein [Elusimicrobiota bacterium]
MKKMILTAFALCIAFAANAAWNQQCFYGKCCVNGIINEKCSAERAKKPGKHFAKKCSCKGHKHHKAHKGHKPCPCHHKPATVAKPAPTPTPAPVTVTRPVPAPVPQPVKTQERLAVGKTITIDGTKHSFSSNKAVVSPEFESYLADKAHDLNGVNYNKVTITGYTDNTGDVAYNNYLSHERAKAVANVLKKNGIPAEKIEAFGKGPLNPIADNKTVEGRKANRRVEISVK